MRSAHAAACDAVSDAVAADYLGDVVSYSRTLARLAVRSGAPATGARAGDGPHVGRPPPPRCPQPAGLPDVASAGGVVVPALLVGGVLLGAHRRLRLHPRRTGRQTRSPANAREADAPRRRRGDRSADRGRLHRVSRPLRREGPEGGPSPPARTGWRRSTIRPDVPDRILRDHRPQGRIRAASASSGTTRGTRWKCRPRKSCASSRARPSAGSSRMRPGIPSPAPGSRSWGRRPSARRMHHVFTIGTAETDAQGRWRLDVAPKDLGGCPCTSSIRATCGGPVPSRSRNLDGVDRPHQGADGDRAGRRRRRPADQGGQGPASATIFVMSRPGRDDERSGRVHPGELRARPDHRHGPGRGLRARVPATSGSRRGPSPWSSRSRSRAATLRGRVVDVEGKPVAGAIFGADTWRGQRSLAVPGHHRQGWPIRMAEHAQGRRASTTPSSPATCRADRSR